MKNFKLSTEGLQVVIAALLSAKPFAVAEIYSSVDDSTQYWVLSGDDAHKAVDYQATCNWEMTGYASGGCVYLYEIPTSDFQLALMQARKILPIVINATPHAITITGQDPIPASGILARVASTSTMIDHPVGRVEVQQLGDITGLPAERIGVFYIVSAMVLAANKASDQPRKDLVAPATGHKDCVRNDKGLIVSVPHFII